MNNKLSLIVLLLFLYCIIQCNPASDNNTNRIWTGDKSPERIGRLVTEDLLSRDQFMMYNTEYVKAIHYAEACAAFGAVRLAGLLNDPLTLSRLTDRYMRVINENIINTANHVDANVYGILPLELCMQTGSEVFFRQGIELADKQWENPLPNGLTYQTRFWIDDIWMIGSLQVQAYRATGNNVYLERAALEIDAYLKRLQQPNGLFYHGENGPFFWGRGNGWVAAGLSELLSVLPESNPYFNDIMEGYKKMMDALVKYQSDDGMWRQLIDVDSAWKETSCTAMFGYALAMGVKRRILKEKKYRQAYEKAWSSLTGYIQADGKISDVCVGTGQSNDLNFYLNRPRVTGDLHGQAPLLWFAYILLADSLSFADK